MAIKPLLWPPLASSPSFLMTGVLKCHCKSGGFMLLNLQGFLPREVLWFRPIYIFLIIRLVFDRSIQVHTLCFVEWLTVVGTVLCSLSLVPGVCEGPQAPHVRHHLQWLLLILNLSYIAQFHRCSVCASNFLQPMFPIESMTFLIRQMKNDIKLDKTENFWYFCGKRNSRGTLLNQQGGQPNAESSDSLRSATLP